jgi:hypothetical protein
VVTSVSQATFDSGSKAIKWSIKASEIWSDTLSGCPSDTDSDVNKYDMFNALNFDDVKLKRKIGLLNPN